MTRVWLLACVCLSLGTLALGAGCGPKVPQHNGYKTKSPWKKAKPITLTDNAGKAKGTLDYAAYKRARWYTVTLPEDGDLNLSLSFSPTDDAGAATVAMEVLDSGYHVISEDEDAPLVAPDEPGDDGDDADAEGDDDEDEDDDEDSGSEESESTQKTRALDALAPGTYYIHLFLTKRLDAADYELQLAYTPMPVEPKTNFPKNVAWVPPLATVPVADDAPDMTPPEPPKPPPCKPKNSKKCKKAPKPPKPPKPPQIPTTPTTMVSADVVAAEAGSGGGSDITINAGTDDGLSVGRKGSLKGVKNGNFQLTSCTAHACKAHVKASPEEVKHSSMAVKIP
jgi:hypothetical protein